MNKAIKHVALAIPIGVPHLERTVRGILAYATEREQWRLATSPDSPILSVAGLRGWPGDGIIAMIETAADARRVAKLGLCAVNVSSAMKHSVVPRVCVDNFAIGRLAAEHLLDCGLRRFAYYGLEKLWYSKLRENGFRKTIERAGGTCDVFLVPSTLGPHAPWYQVDNRLRDWLKSLTPPVGLLASSDYRARLIIESCRELQLAVPDDVAVVGVNNDQIACDFCDPPLSSVSRNSEREGYEAAALLDRMMAGQEPPKHDVLVLPEGVVRRRSTDVMAITEPEVAAAVQYMRSHLSETVVVEDLANRQGISRRSLEHAFRRTLGRTPHRYLTYLRIQRAQQLLVEQPSLTLQAVAKACGFCDAKRLRLAFARLVHLNPNEYRRIFHPRP